MKFSRRQFIGLTIKGAVILGVGSNLKKVFAEESEFPKKEDIQLRFILASDGHYGLAKTDYKKMHEDMLNWINAEVENGLDFVFINGDLIHNNPKFLPEVKALWDRLKVPYYVSHGNHDRVSNEVWEKNWGMSVQYAFEKKEIPFLVLNTANEKGDYVMPDIDGAKAELEKLKSKKQMILIMHIPPMDVANKKTKGHFGDFPEMLSLINSQPNLKTIFMGHDHDQDGVFEKDGRFYIFDSHIGSNWGTKYHGYRVVEVLKNGDIFTYQVNPSTASKVNNQKIALA